MNLYESIKLKLNETVGYATEETISAVTEYYSKLTGASVMSRKETHTTGGGYSHMYYYKVLFNDDTEMVFLDNRSHMALEIHNPHISGDYTYKFDIWEKDYKDDLTKFVNGENPGGYRFRHEDNELFDLQDAIDNKGALVMELQDNGDNKEDMINKFNSLPDDFPVITCSGLWNSMNDGRLTTKGNIKDWDFSSIYGGKDEFEIYDNLVFIKTVSGSEMF